MRTRPLPRAPPTISVPVLLPSWPCAAPTATSLPFCSTRLPLPRLPTTSVLEAEKTLATRSSPPSSVTVPWPVAWLPIVAFQAVTWPVMPRFMPLIRSEPVPASPTVSRPLLVHSPPLTMTLPRAPTDWPMSPPPSLMVEATPRSSSVPVPAPPTTTVPSAVICSRLSTVPVLPLCWPMTKLSALDAPPTASAPPDTSSRPVPVRPTITCCCAVSSAPPVSVSAPPLSTTAARPPMPWATMLPVSVVVPKLKSWPTAPLPVAVWSPVENRATLPPPGAVVPTVQLVGIGEVGAAGAGCHSKAPETAVLVTSIGGGAGARGRVGDGDRDRVARRAARLVGQRLQVLLDLRQRGGERRGRRGGDVGDGDAGAAADIDGRRSPRS